MYKWNEFTYKPTDCTYEVVVWRGRSGRYGVIDDADSVVPRASPLQSRVAVRVRAVTVTHVVLPRAVVNVAVVVVVRTVASPPIPLPAACRRTRPECR